MTNQPIQMTKQNTPLENVNNTQNSQFFVENHVQNQKIRVFFFLHQKGT
jgi:hypothetical protein